jgi:glycosyltransferase involved in cell wall biosynthesis
VPTRRFRVQQLIRPLHQLGIDVSEHCLFMNKYELPPRPWLTRVWGAGKLLGRTPGLLASRFSDITWLERELYPGRFTLESIAGSKRLFDVDDAIWLTGNANFSEEIAARSFGVIAGNQFIADHYQTQNQRVWIVPTSVDTNRWKASERKPGPWTVGWIGSSSTLKYLHLIEDSLAEFLAHHSDSRLLVVCDVKPGFSKLAKDQWQFEPWSAKTEVELIQKMDVGVMPLPDSDWSRGKCSLKMLLYMAVGIPVVVSPVGHNKEVLQWNDVGFAAETTGEWYDALSSLFNDSDLAARLGKAGRAVVEEHYSVHVNSAALARIFREVASD